MSKLGKIYNHKKDMFDGSEKKFDLAHSENQLPTHFDLRDLPFFPPILNQGDLGSCGPTEISNALRFCIGKELGANAEWQPSRLFIYYFTRLLEGSPLDQDTGISIKSGLESISRYGACNEDLWPYNISDFAKPPSSVSIKSAHDNIKNFHCINVPQSITHVKSALVSGFPVIIGIQVYSSFESDTVAQTGIVPMPSDSDTYLGGHCVSIVGYSDDTKTFTCSNSWGTNWGKQGFFTIPYDYINDSSLASDFWICKYFD